MKVAPVTVDSFTGSEKVPVTFALTWTPVAASAGETDVTSGAVASDPSVNTTSTQ